MDNKMVDVTLHIDETTSHDEREELRDEILKLNGVLAAASHDNRPHLMVIEYSPDEVSSSEFLNVVKNRGLHAELVGL